MFNKILAFLIFAGVAGMLLGAHYGSPMVLEVSFFVFVFALVARILKTQGGGVPPA
jgi:hypothetical protein